MPDNIRPHIIMGIIILVLALALITLTFIPRQVHAIQQPVPGSSGPTSLSNQQTSSITSASNDALVTSLLA